MGDEVKAQELLGGSVNTVIFSSAMNPVERKKPSRQFHIRSLDEMAYGFPPVGWTKQVAMHSAMVKGWIALPHHFLNVEFATLLLRVLTIWKPCGTRSEFRKRDWRN
jgi:hypothetical protein